MATNRLAIAALAATLTLAGCVSPYEDAIKVDLANCQGGNQTACGEVPSLQAEDKAWHQQKNAEVARGVALGALILLSAGAAAAAAHGPPPAPAPVFIPAPPVPMLPPPPVVIVPRW